MALRDPFDPFGLSEPNPADIRPPFQPIVSDWGQLWQVGWGMFGGAQGQMPNLPNSFNVPYGSDLITASLADFNRPALAGSRNYAYGLDEEAFGRTVTTLVGEVVAQFGGQLSENQIKAIRSAANALAIYGNMGLDVAERLMTQDGDAGAGLQAVRFLRRGLEAFHGPSGSRVPLYYAMSNLAENVPLSQRDALLMQTMRQISPVNGKVAGGFTNRQLASMLSSAASMGYNVFNNVDTRISKELANQQLSTFANSLNFSTTLTEEEAKKQAEQIYKLSSIQTGETFGKLAEEGNLTQALNNSLVGDVLDSEERAGRLAARNQFSRFLDVTNRIQSIEGYNDKTPQTFEGLISMRSEIDNLAKNTKDTKQKQYYQDIVKDINAIEKSVGEDYRKIDIKRELQEAEDYQRKQLTKVANDKNIYTDSPEQQARFVEAMIQREKLSAYNVDNLDARAEDDKWKTLLTGANEEKKAALTAYYKKGGLHEAYLQAKKDISDKDYEKTVGLLKRYQEAATPEAKQALIDANPELQSYLNQWDVQFQAQQIDENTRRLAKPSSIMKTALAANGTPIEDENQRMAFINKVTYGGLGNMSEDTLATVVSQIGSGMIDSGASGNDLMQMAGRGAEAALSVGGDAQAGAINAMKAGLAARAVAKTMHMDPNKAQEIAAQAAGKSNKSLVERTYNALGTFLQNRDITGDKEEYNNILNKIKNNENLTQDELNTLYRDSSKIMSYAGMSADVQHSLLNAIYSGGPTASAASRAGTTWLMFSTDAQNNMQDNIQQRMGLWKETKDMSDTDKETVAKAITANFQDVDNKELLTNVNKAEEYKKQLLKNHPELADKLEGIPANVLQHFANMALGAEGARTGQTPEQVLAAAHLAKQTPETMLVQERMAALRDITPDVVSNTFGNFIDALTQNGGSLEKALISVSTAVSDSTLKPEEREALLSNMVAATLTDPKLAEQAGVGGEAIDILRNLYEKGAKNDPKTIANVFKYLRGDLKEEELDKTERKNLQEAIGTLSKEDRKTLTETLDRGVTNLRKKYEKKEELKLAGDKNTVPENSEPVSSTSTTPGSSTTKPKAGGSGDEGEPDKPTTASAAPAKVTVVQIEPAQFKDLKDSLRPESNPTQTT